MYIVYHSRYRENHIGKVYLYPIHIQYMLQLYIFMETQLCSLIYSPIINYSNNTHTQSNSGSIVGSVYCIICLFPCTDIVRDSLKPYSEKDVGKFSTVVMFDCRGIEPIDFSPRVSTLYMYSCEKAWSSRTGECLCFEHFLDISLLDY